MLFDSLYLNQSIIKCIIKYNDKIKICYINKINVFNTIEIEQ